jgi:serine/threonine-protein kinase
MAAAELHPGDTVGPYTVERPLGEGGMARVYKAVGPDGDVVALKLVRPELAVENMFRRRFAREIRTAVRVDHPHVVPVLDSGEHDGVPYMAQPFIRGGSLQDKLEREGPLELEVVVTLCLHVAKGVGALHEHGLIHRDLKPANILLDERGHAFVADFGLAKDPQASLITRPGQAVGSLDYMAPEQIRAQGVTPAADIYSLGCVIFECVAGKPPFAHRQGMQILWAHLQDEPPDPCADRPDVPKDFAWAITSALEKDPATRPGTATAYARLVQVAAGVPPLSPGRDA